MKRIALIFLLMISLMLNGCEQKLKDIDQKIVFIYREICYFGFYMNSGYYIDNMGNKVLYDVSNESQEYSDMGKLYEYLLATMDSAESEPFLSKQVLNECYQYLYSIDLDAEIEEGSFCNDYGEDELYGVRMTEDQEPTLILIKRVGNFTSTNTDENAAKIAHIFDSDFREFEDNLSD